MSETNRDLSILGDSGHKSLPVLDHGYVKYIESWGYDERIIEAARMSTNKGFVDWDEDAKLLSYLYKHGHMTPFEMAGLVIEVKAPIFVFREWHRHRTQSYNEMSARYIPLPDENYIPLIERCMMGNDKNKQAGSVAPTNEGHITSWQRRLESFYEAAQNMYQDALDAGIPKEIARIVLPVGRYSKMRASANLRNWLGFLTLRTAPNAQYEIRQYALAVELILINLFPRTMNLFSGERMEK